MTKTMEIYDLAHKPGVMSTIEEGIKRVTFDNEESISVLTTRLRKKPKVIRYRVTVTLTEIDDNVPN